MQKLWKLVLEGRGCTDQQAAAMRLRFQYGTNVGTFDAVREKLAELGMTNGGGRPYSRARITQFVYDGVCTSLAMICDKSRIGDERYEAKIRRAAAAMLRQKVHYSCSTEDDPYLKGRLEWWQFRKVGKKWNSSWYERKSK